VQDLKTVLQIKGAIEQGSKRVAAVPGDRKATTLLRPIRSKRRHDQIATVSDRLCRSKRVRGLILGVIEEVQGGPIMPKINLAIEHHVSRIGDDKSHLVSTFTKPQLQFVQRLAGNINGVNA
jgi:hypothetical protein